MNWTIILCNLQTYSSQVSPLHIASSNNYSELSKVLLNAGAKLDAKDSDGKVNTVVIQGQKVINMQILWDQGRIPTR